MFRTAGAATLRSFSELKKPPERVLGLQVLLQTDFFQNQKRPRNVLRPASATTLRSFAKYKKSPGTCSGQACKCCHLAEFFRIKKAPRTCFRPASAAPNGFFPKSKKPPECVQACKCCYHADFFRIKRAHPGTCSGLQVLLPCGFFQT
jgi:hypothetical protein